MKKSCWPSILKPMAICLLLFTGAETAGAAGIALDRMIVEFKPEKRPIENVTVISQSDAPTKVTVSVIKIVKPASTKGGPEGKEVNEPTQDLVVSPKSFDLGPKEARTTRIVLKKRPEDVETAYRVLYTPDRPAFSKDAETKKTAKEGAIKVNFIVGMGALVIAAPKDPRPSLKFERKGDKIIFTNDGNISAQLQSQEYCAEDKKHCATLEGRRIIPGSSWEMSVPDTLRGIAFTQSVLINGKYSKLTYPGK